MFDFLIICWHSGSNSFSTFSSNAMPCHKLRRGSSRERPPRGGGGGGLPLTFSHTAEELWETLP